MRYRLIPAIVVLAASLVVSAQVLADGGGRPFSTQLSGAEEQQAADPDGSGMAEIQVNLGQGEICYQLSVEDIAPATAAHIHVGSAGVNGPVVVPLAPPTEGSSAGCAEVDPVLAKAILRHPEEYYVNVHNADFPAGAVRGQLSK